MKIFLYPSTIVTVEINYEIGKPSLGQMELRNAMKLQEDCETGMTGMISVSIILYPTKEEIIGEHHA